MITEQRLDKIEERADNRIQEMKRDALRGILPPVLQQQMRNLERTLSHVEVLRKAQDHNLTTAQ